MMQRIIQTPIQGPLIAALAGAKTPIARVNTRGGEKR